jgi:predicted metal-dependent hydrolase
VNIPLKHRILARGRRISIRIAKDGTIILTRPRVVSERTALRFLEEKKEWALKHIQHIQKQKTRMASLQWKDDGLIPFLDQELILSVALSRGRSPIHRVENTLHVSAHPDDSERIKTLVERWYRLQAEHYFHLTCSSLVQKLGVSFRRISIKGQTSRWGSCSKQGNLNFNWKLMMAPELVAFSVAVHECCHLVHLNHSSQFWNLVYRLCPRYKDAAQWLKEQGGTLG